MRRVGGFDISKRRGRLFTLDELDSHINLAIGYGLFATARVHGLCHVQLQRPCKVVTQGRLIGCYGRCREQDEEQCQRFYIHAAESKRRLSRDVHANITECNGHAPVKRDRGVTFCDN